MQSNRLLASPISALAARTLKVVGLVIVITALIDIAILPLPYQFADRQWQINFISQVVDRGIIPLVGIVLFVTGYWIDSSTSDAPPRRSAWQDPRFWAFVLSSFLGLMYLLMFPLHLNNVRLSNQDAQTQIGQQVTQAQTEFDTRIQAELDSQRQQISQLVTASDDQIKQLVDAQQLSPEQAELVRKFKSDPNAIEPFLKEREAELRGQLQTQIGSRQTEAQQLATTEALKSGLRVSISSLLLAIGFIVIGWNGLRSLRQL